MHLMIFKLYVTLSLIQKLKLRNQEAKDKEMKNTAVDVTASTSANTMTMSTSSSSRSNDSSSVSSSSSVLAAKSCNTCGGNFCDATSYRNHFRSDWHRYNLNQKLKNLPLVASEEDFAKLSLKELENNSIIR